jgi:hypothetical protein
VAVFNIKSISELIVQMFGTDPEFLSKLVGLDVEVMVSISNQVRDCE